MSTILVVEDTGLNLLLLDVMLRRMNLQVLFAHDGYEALCVLEKTPVNLVLTDINMPVMDGFELLERIRQEERFRELPVVMMTASVLNSTNPKATKFGAAAVLNHPFSSFELERVISAQFREAQE